MHSESSRLPFVISAVVALFSLSLVASAAPATWVVDPVHSNVGFKVRHLLTPVSGEFSDFSGTIVYDAEDPASSSVEMVVQSASIDTDNERRDGHLRSPDFFDVENHPTLSFQSKKVVKLGDNLAVTGDLTIRGVTHEVTFPVQVLGVMGDKAGFSTEFTIDRQDYGVSWNKVLDQGGTILGDEVTVELSFEADRKAEEPMEGDVQSGR